MTPMIYIAHALGDGPDRAANIENAERWTAWVGRMFVVAPVAPWTTLARHWGESWREVGLGIDAAVIERCDAVWLVGGRVSEGMVCEAEYAADHGVPAHLLTWLGAEPVGITLRDLDIVAGRTGVKVR